MPPKRTRNAASATKSSKRKEGPPQQQPTTTSKKQQTEKQKKQNIRNNELFVPKCQALGINLNPLRLTPLQKLLAPFELATMVVADANNRFDYPSEEDKLTAYIPPGSGHMKKHIPSEADGYKLALFRMTNMYYNLVKVPVKNLYEYSMLLCEHDTERSERAGRMVTWEKVEEYYHEASYFFFHLWCLKSTLSKAEVIKEGLALLEQQYTKLGDAKK